MNTEYWKELVTVIECGSLTAAAEKLGYTLSGISRSMASLEQELGFQLLYRGKKGVRPTKECMRLMPYIHELLYAAERLNQASASIKGAEEGVIKIGTAYRHYYRWLTQVTSEFHEQHPGVHFQIYHGTSTEFAEQVREHQMDFALISERAGNHEWLPICRDPLIAVLPENHPLTNQKKLPLNAFKEEAYVETCPGLDIDSSRYFEKYNFHPNIQFSTMDVQATYAMVEAGMGISITNQINSLPEYKGVCHRELELEEIIEIGLAYQADLSPASDAFFKFIKNRLPKSEKALIAGIEE